MERAKLKWQSKAVLLLVLPGTAVEVVLQARQWTARDGRALAWMLALSAALGLLAWVARAGTAAAATTGALITASVMMATAEEPFQAWRTGLVPVMTVLVLTSAATRFGRARKERPSSANVYAELTRTRFGRARKERLGTAEKRRGRVAAQVAANLGLAAMVTAPAATVWMADRLAVPYSAALPFFTMALAALAEAAADTVSSEIGQVLGGWPVMLTTLRRVEAGTDGAISIAGTLAGVAAAGAVAGAGTLALGGGGAMLAVSWAGGVFGQFFDSLLGATLERRGWLNNDAVNFLSTASAAGFAMALLMRIGAR